MKDIKPFRRNTRCLIGCAVVLLLIFTMLNCSQKRPLDKFKPPIAKKIPKKLNIHGHTRMDNYCWLRERDNPEFIEYLRAENNYLEKVMAHTEALQEALFEEIRGRIKETDLSVPERKGDYYYYRRWEEGKDYPVYARKRGFLEPAEEILLDVNELASPQEWGLHSSVEQFGNHFYFMTSDEGENARLMRTLVDHTGREQWENVISLQDDGRREINIEGTRYNRHSI